MTPSFSIQFQADRFLRICRYAQASLDLPRLFYNALSLLDSQEGSDSFHLLFQFQSLCHEWNSLSGETVKLLQNLSAYGAHLSHFCREEAAVIKALPPAEQCQTGFLPDSMHAALCDMHRQAVRQAQDSLRFQHKADSIRRCAENDLQPQAAVFKKMLDAQPSLAFKSQWLEFEIPHCGFLKDHPVVSSLIRDLENASSESEARSIWDGLQETAQSLWSGVQDAFTHMGTLDEELAGAGSDIRQLNALWTSAGQYLDSIRQALSAALDSGRLLTIRSQLELCASQWESIARSCQDFAAQLTAEKNM